MRKSFGYFFLIFFLSNVYSQIIVELITEEEKLALRDLKNTNPSLSPLNGWNTTQFDNTTLYCGWEGVTCGDTGIVQLNLAGRGLVRIPSSVFTNFREMQVFRVNDNQLTQATLPSQNVNIGKDRQTFNFFDMQRTQLSGSLPSTFMLSNVRFMYLNENGLNGSIPNEIGNMKALWELNLGFNRLSGSIPGSISSLKELQTLNISSNLLSGQLPASMANLTQLTILDLSNNRLTGPIPDFKFSPQIRTVLLQGNQFDSLVPSFLTTFTGTANFSGVSFRCPIPPCSGGVACVLSGLQCYCPCNDTGGGNCVLDTLECRCNPERYGTRCNSICVGTTVVNGVVKPCSGHGTCRNGPSGDGSCICDVGYGGLDCASECPKARNQTCGGYGTCTSEGQCVCNPYRTGLACLQCAVGYAGPECAIECRRHEDRICNDQGECNELGECDCLGGYFGTSCEFEPEESSVNAWLVVGILLIIFFVAAVAGLAVGGYYYYKKRKDYEELESKYAQNEVDREMDEFRSKRDENDTSFSGIMAKKKTLQLDQI